MLGTTLLQKPTVKKVYWRKLEQLMIAAILFTKSGVALYSQQTIQPGITDSMPEGVTTALTDICVSANSQTLAGWAFTVRCIVLISARRVASPPTGK
ncbi:MAG: hypothetical protein EAY72_12700 [Bacteroidetes bacterium]|nr:MAG: hypothetical protein EAY72_12700 [Bacteroidota bacterium]